MRLEETTLRLCLDRRKLYICGREPKVDPQRQLRDVDTRRAVEDQLSNYLLDPGCTGLRISADDDVIVSKRKIIPKR